jgi:hypothetical protein
VLCLQDLSVSDWEELLRQQRDGESEFTDDQLTQIREKKNGIATKVHSLTLWFSDMSFRLTQMKNDQVYLATKLLATALDSKKYYETLPIIARRVCGSVPYVPNCGLVVQAIAYEREPEVVEPDEDASEEDHLAYLVYVAEHAKRAQVLLQYMPVFEMQKEMTGMSWKETVEAFPEVTSKPSTYILAMFQGPEEGKKQIVLTASRYPTEMLFVCVVSW